MGDDFESIGAAAAKVVNGVALGPGEETEPSATALAGTGGTRRAHHDARGGAGVVIHVQFGKRTGAAGPTSPPRQDFRNRTQGHPPATGGLGNARRAKT